MKVLLASSCTFSPDTVLTCVSCLLSRGGAMKVLIASSCTFSPDTVLSCISCLSIQGRCHDSIDRV